MITAGEAKKIVEESDAVLNEILNELDNKIRSTASKGFRSYACYEHKKIPWQSVPTFGPKPSAEVIHMKLIKKLKSLGFNAVFEADGSAYNPLAYQDDTGKGPLYINYVLKIYW